MSQPELAEWIDQTVTGDAVFFPDTCFITGPTLDAAIWKTLFERQIGISKLVLQELRGWTLFPTKHHQLWQHIISPMPDNLGPVWIDRPDRWTPEHQLGIRYYVNLLAERKRFARELVVNWELENGRSATEDEINDLVQRGRPARDYSVLRSGEQQLRTGGNAFTDEELVVTASAVGLSAGRPSIVLTRDRGVFDQYVKLTGLLIFHYLAMLFANRYAATPESFGASPMPTGDEILDAYFVSEKSTLVRKPVHPDEFVDWLLPPTQNVVMLGCILLGGDGDSLSRDFYFFEAERGMDLLIRMKGRAHGQNTDRLKGRNCHVTGFPKTTPDPRNHVLVVQDRETYAPDGALAFPALDIAHVRNHFENLGYSNSG